METNSLQNFKTAFNEIIGRETLLDSDAEPTTIEIVRPSNPVIKEAPPVPKTTISAGTKIDGNITTDNDLIVEGIITGNVSTSGILLMTGEVFGSIHARQCDLRCALVNGKNITIEEQLVITNGCTVHSELSAKRIVVEGIVEGNIRAEESLHLSASAKVKGNMTVGQLVVDKGACLEGNITMVRPY